MGILKNDGGMSTSSNDEDVSRQINTHPRSYGDLSKSDEPKPQSKFPKGVFLIILNEFCERFSYYGLKTILIIYLTKFLLLNDNTATGIYHAFAMLCYFCPLLGAIIADAYIGQYKTIVSLSIVYFLGELVLTLTAIKPLGAPNLPGPIIGLLLIALGTGGIKPCVAAFGASQFSSDQKNYLDTFFSMFYFSINAGSLISTILTPILRNDVKCFNADCFPIAFGVPTALMFVALVVFLLGTRSYVRKPKPSENVFKNVFNCIVHALRMKVRYRGDDYNKKESWLDYSVDRFGVKLVSDVKALLRVLLVFVPVPIFWTLFDQQGSRWTLQAQKLNTYLNADSTYALKPDQVQAVNPVLILALIPVFNWIVYPIFAKCNLLKKLLSRMTVGNYKPLFPKRMKDQLRLGNILGMLLCALAFVCSGLLELQIQNSYKSSNINDKIQFVNLASCNLNVQTNFSTTVVNSNENFQSSFEASNINVACLDGVQSRKSLNLQLSRNTDSYKNVYVFYNNDANNLDFIHIQGSLLSQPIGGSQARFFSIGKSGNLNINLKAGSISYNFPIENAASTVSADTKYENIDFNVYDITIDNQNMSFSDSFNFLNGARYTLLYYKNSATNSYGLLKLTDLYEYKISIFYQLIQIFVITMGEILVSISGLAFAYSQAPESMKSILQAAWLLTVAIGNLIVFVVAESQIISNQFYEYLFFAGLMAITTIVFGLIAFFYKYVEDENEASGDGSLNKRAEIEAKEELVSSSVQLIKMDTIKND
jgi:solute carrier family 15 oligopeptide transporter 1